MEVFADAVYLLSLTVDSFDDNDPLKTFTLSLLQMRREVGISMKLPFLTPREHLILSEFCEGHANKGIARKLGLSAKVYDEVMTATLFRRPW